MSHCKSRNIIQFGQRQRVFQTVPVGGRKVELVIQNPRLQCKDCGAIKQPRLAFADPEKHYTRSLKRFVIDLCHIMSTQDAAEPTGLSWDTVKEIHKTRLRRKYKSFNLKKVRHIAIDEVYPGKKRKYITLVLDLRTGRVIHIGKGKGKGALKGFWRPSTARSEHSNVMLMATEMMNILN